MKGFLQNCSGRLTYDGWALCLDGMICDWTVSTTREEVRSLRRRYPDLFNDGGKIVKVKISVEPVE